MERADTEREGGGEGGDGGREGEEEEPQGARPCAPRILGLGLPLPPPSAQEKET